MTQSYSLDLRVRVADFVAAGHSCRPDTSNYLAVALCGDVLWREAAFCAGLR
jgi:hypothetical protein